MSTPVKRVIASPAPVKAVQKPAVAAVKASTPQLSTPTPAPKPQQPSLVIRFLKGIRDLIGNGFTAVIDFFKRLLGGKKPSPLPKKPSVPKKAPDDNPFAAKDANAGTKVVKAAVPVAAAVATGALVSESIDERIRRKKREEEEEAAHMAEELDHGNKHKHDDDPFSADHHNDHDHGFGDYNADHHNDHDHGYSGDSADHHWDHHDAVYDGGGDGLF